MSMSNRVAVVSVDYTEFQPWTFKGVVVSLDNAKERFNTLDEAYAFAYANAEKVLNSSSVDDYEADLKNCKRH